MAEETDENKRYHIPPMPDRSTRRPGMRIGLAGLVAVLIIGGGAGYLGGRMGASSRAADNTSAQRQSAFREGELINTIAKDVSPSVVSVNVTSTQQGGTDSVFDQYFGRRQQSSQQQSAGTGIILSKDGVIMTNRHVIPAGTSKVSVTLSDGTELDDVDVVGRASDNSGLDVAFLKVKDTKGKTLRAAKLGDSSKTQVGDRVVAIGNALGQFQNTVTSGIVSGYGRSVEAGSSGGDGSDAESLQDLFQTDAAINEGNSGGPLVNANSEVIGMNTAIAGNAQSIGFAIPVNDLQGLIRTVLRTGKFEQPYLGVRYVTLTDDIAQQLKLSTKRGAYVLPQNDANGQQTIVPDSPADKAGLKEKDIIQAVNGKNIDNNRSLTALLAQHSVNETVELKVLRGNDTQTIRVKLEATPNN